MLVKKYLCSNQCVNSCGNDYYEMGKYCFSDCTGGNRKEVDWSIKKCECRYLYYITSDNEYICYNQNQYCEDIHKSYDYDTRLCKTENSCDKKKYEFHRVGHTENFIRCPNTCLKGEYLDKTNSNLWVKNCDKYYKEDRTTKEK